MTSLKNFRTGSYEYRHHVRFAQNFVLNRLPVNKRFTFYISSSSIKVVESCRFCHFFQATTFKLCRFAPVLTANQLPLLSNCYDLLQFPPFGRTAFLERIGEEHPLLRSVTIFTVFTAVFLERLRGVPLLRFVTILNTFLVLSRPDFGLQFG